MGTPLYLARRGRDGELPPFLLRGQAYFFSYARLMQKVEMSQMNQSQPQNILI